MTPDYDYNGVQIYNGDALETLKQLPAGCVQTCVTSPPYFGLRSYLPEGHADKPLEVGTEDTPAAYVARLVTVFAEVRRTLRDDGTLWLNLGDSYASGGGSSPNAPSAQHSLSGQRYREAGGSRCDKSQAKMLAKVAGLKHKDLIGIPWRVAFALQENGWYLRSDIIWHKPNPMPESVTDRPTKAHEYLFLLSKSERYFYDAEAIKEPDSGKNGGRFGSYPDSTGRKDASRARPDYEGRNKRSVWTVATRPYTEAHFATFPPDLIRPCILAGCPEGGTVLDPFGGSGTTALVAKEERRKAILIELNPEYICLAQQRLQQGSLFGDE
jgi:DNA modification methylase